MKDNKKRDSVRERQKERGREGKKESEDRSGTREAARVKQSDINFPIISRKTSYVPFSRTGYPFFECHLRIITYEEKISKIKWKQIKFNKKFVVSVIRYEIEKEMLFEKECRNK